MRERSMSRYLRWIGLAFVCVVSRIDVAAQSPGSGPLTLNDAIQLALKNYPAIKESRARARAAEEGVGVARTAYLPRLDMMWQENRGTTNNVFGLLFPQSTLFSMTGPVLGTRSLGDSVWGNEGTSISQAVGNEAVWPSGYPGMTGCGYGGNPYGWTWYVHRAPQRSGPTPANTKYDKIATVI